MSEHEKNAARLKGLITCTVHKCTDLTDRQLIGKQDPYVRLECGNEHFKTEAKSGTNPVYEQTFIFNLGGGEDLVHVHVYDKEITVDRSIGRVDLRLKDIYDKSKPTAYELFDKDNFTKKRGWVHLSFSFKGTGGEGVVTVTTTSTTQQQPQQYPPAQPAYPPQQQPQQYPPPAQYPPPSGYPAQPYPQPGYPAAQPYAQPYPQPQAVYQPAPVFIPAPAPAVIYTPPVVMPQHHQHHQHNVSYMLVARHSNKALTVNGGQGGNGEQHHPHRGGGQIWYTHDCGGGYVNIINRSTGLYLDVSGAGMNDGASVICWAGNGQPNQQWRLEPTDSGFFVITARHSGKSLDVDAASHGDGARILQWATHRGHNQQFRMEAC